MLSECDVAVIGGGIFGAEIALAAASLGLSVQIFETKKTLMSGASKNNQNRLHLGFHYPRDLETGRQSLKGFYSFKEKYAECITGQFDNAYFIASEGSFTKPDEYLKFCDELGVRYRQVPPREFPVEIRGVDLGILCEEEVYDAELIRSFVKRALDQSNVTIVPNTRIDKAEHVEGGIKVFDEYGNEMLSKIVINATYSDINRITESLGYTVNENQYEYTAVPIISLDIPPVGVTVMDGPFFTLLPYGKSGNYLLYGVKQSVVQSTTTAQMPAEWHYPETAPFNNLNPVEYFSKIQDAFSSFMPIISDAKNIGFLQGPRMVLAGRDDTDARPSVTNIFDDKYITVFSGKIDHSIWVADEIKVFLRNKFML